MSDTATLEQTTPQVEAHPFDESSWKTTPTEVPVAESKDPVIEEKDKQIEKEKPTSDKPDEPEKIPEATPKPIQERPENNDPATKDDKPLKFANEESEKIFNLLKEGKKDEVFTILSEQKRLSEVDKLPAADIIKLNLQYQNKDFTQQEINELFEDTYSMPEKPEQEIGEGDDEFKVKMDKYEASVVKIENRIKRDAKPAINELQKLQKEIVIPDIIKDQSPKEPTQEELEAKKVQIEQYKKSAADGLKSFNGFETTFKDEEVELKVGYKPTEEEKKALMPLLDASISNEMEMYKMLGWVTKEGAVDNNKVAQDLFLLQNKDKVFAKIASETGKQRHAESIKSIKNINYDGGQKNSGDLGAQPQELQRKMATHFFQN